MRSSRHIIGATLTIAPKLVRLFYTNLEVVQNDDNGIILQSTIVGHVITVDTQIIS
jgi:hypothetical protein